MTRKWQLIILIPSIAVIGGLGTYFVARDSNPIPPKIQKSVQFPLYYPQQLPKGWQVDSNSFSQGSNVVLFRITDKNNTSKGVSVTIQPQQDTFDIDRFYKETLTKSTQFTTSLGQAAIGEGTLGTRVGSIVTGESWILVTAPKDNATNSDIRTILSSLIH